MTWKHSNIVTKNRKHGL